MIFYDLDDILPFSHRIKLQPLQDEETIRNIALETMEGHQRAIMGQMTVEEIYQDRKAFSVKVFEVASTDLMNMGIFVVSYTLKVCD